MYLRGFVVDDRVNQRAMLQIRVSDIGLAFCARMSVAGTSKVEGTISGCLGTNAILASKHIGVREKFCCGG